MYVLWCLILVAVVLVLVMIGVIVCILNQAAEKRRRDQFDREQYLRTRHPSRNRNNSK